MHVEIMIHDRFHVWWEFLFENTRRRRRKTTISMWKIGTDWRIMSLVWCPLVRIQRLTEVTAETEPWTVLNVCAQCSARRSWTACKRRSMRANQCNADQTQGSIRMPVFFSSSSSPSLLFFRVANVSTLVWTEQNASNIHNRCRSVWWCHFILSLFFFPLSLSPPPSRAHTHMLFLLSSYVYRFFFRRCSFSTFINRNMCVYMIEYS